MALYVAGILALVEVGLRLVEPQLLIPYEPGRLRRVATRERLRAYGPPDIAFLGSSRSQSALLVPEIRESLEARLKDNLRVESYATGAGTGLEAYYLVQWMLREKKVPKVVVFEAMPEDLYRPDEPYTQCAYYWSLSDWWAERKAHPQVDEWFGIVVRNELADGLALFRYRDRPLNLLKDLGRGHVSLQSPVYGAYEQNEHLDAPDERIAELDYEGLRAHLQDHHLTDGALKFYEDRAGKVEQALRALREAGSRVYYVSVPASEFFASGYPDGALEAFEARFERLAQHAGVEYVSGAPLHARWRLREHFRDGNHVNRAGAEIASAWIADEVLGPRLEGPKAQLNGSR